MRKLTDANRLSIVRPDLIEDWDFEMNTNVSPDKVTYSSRRKVWWKCPYGHPSYMASLNNRANGTTCPYCRGRKVCAENSLESLFPELIKEWHPTRNLPLTPDQVMHGIARKVWWLCRICGHEYLASINARTNPRTRNGCPYCHPNGRKKK